MSKLTQFGTRGRRMLVVAVAVSATATTGAAAAAGHAPWSSPQRPTFEAAGGSEPITVPTTTPITVTGAADGATASGSSGGEFVAPTNTTTTTTIVAATTSTAAPTSTTSTVVTTEPVATSVPPPAPTEPSPPASPAPPTTRADTQVPQTMSLTCTATGDALQNTVACTWTNGAGAGFSKYRLLRGDGGSRGRVPFTSSEPNANSFVDSALPAGNFSYVLVALDANEKAIGHSNPVYIQILPAG